MNRITKYFLPAPLKRGRSDAADFMRVMSIFLIAWFHIWQQSWLNPNIVIGSFRINLYAPVTCGYLFVDLMLLLSGFLLMLSYLGQKKFDRRTFYTARAARIMPAYLVCLIIFFLLNMLPRLKYIGTTNLLIDIFSHLTFTHNLFPESYIGTNFNGVLWTLAVEVQFYLIFPFIARTFEKHPIHTYAVMTAFGLFARWYIGRYFPDTSLYFNRLPAMADVYANGMLAALIYHKLENRPQSAWSAWLNTLIAVIMCIGIVHISRVQRTYGDYDAVRAGQMRWRFLLSAAGAVFLVSGSRSVLLMRRFFSNRITIWLSSVTFGFYMLHQFLACKLKEWHIPSYGEGYTGTTPNMDGQVVWQHRYTIICFAVALLAAALLTYAVEKPCAKLIKKHFSASKLLETNRVK